MRTDVTVWWSTAVHLTKAHLKKNNTWHTPAHLCKMATLILHLLQYVISELDPYSQVVWQKSIFPLKTDEHLLTSTSFRPTFLCFSQSMTCIYSEFIWKTLKNVLLYEKAASVRKSLETVGGSVSTMEWANKVIFRSFWASLSPMTLPTPICR